MPGTLISDISTPIENIGEPMGNHRRAYHKLTRAYLNHRRAYQNNRCAYLKHTRAYQKHRRAYHNYRRAYQIHRRAYQNNAKGLFATINSLLPYTESKISIHHKLTFLVCYRSGRDQAFHFTGFLFQDKISNLFGIQFFPE